jgi:hypothetical protein
MVRNVNEMERKDEEKRKNWTSNGLGSLREMG